MGGLHKVHLIVRNILDGLDYSFRNLSRVRVLSVSDVIFKNKFARVEKTDRETALFSRGTNIHFLKKRRGERWELSLFHYSTLYPQGSGTVFC